MPLKRTAVLFNFLFSIFYFYFLSFICVFLSGCLEKEGEVGRFALDEGCTSGRRVAAENGSYRQIKCVGTRRVDGHGLHNTLCSFRVEEFLAVVDEDMDVRVLGEDQVRCLGRINGNVAVVHDEGTNAVPSLGKIPFGLQLVGDRQERTFLLEDHLEGRILLRQNLLTFGQVPVVCLRIEIRHVPDELIGLLERRDHLALDGFAGDHVEELAQTAILVGHVHPAINAIDRVEPLGDRSIGVEVLVRLESRTAVGVDGACMNGPLLDRRRMVIDAGNGAGTALEPLLASTLRNRNVQEPNVSSFHRLGRRPRVRLRGGDRKQLNVAVLAESVVGEVRREPAVDAVAVEENGRLVGGHGIWMEAE